LKEEEANQPDGCSASKLREDDLRDQGFNLKQKKRAGKDSERVQSCHAPVHSRCLNADGFCLLGGIAFHFNLMSVRMLSYRLITQGDQVRESTDFCQQKETGSAFMSFSHGINGVDGALVSSR
jgi:hypothetical protein